MFTPQKTEFIRSLSGYPVENESFPACCNKSLASKRCRLDILLFSRGLVESQNDAQRLIIAGKVKVAGMTVSKPATIVSPDVHLEINPGCPYVSRGGTKLAAALEHFGFSPAGKICLDVGASTGGFTDCLLQHGAEKVYALDVGRYQLHWRLRNDPRVINLEKTNIRYLEPGRLSPRPNFITIDVSFISLKKVLPKISEILPPRGQAVVLVKPQFEVERRFLQKGVVRDEQVREKAVKEIVNDLENRGFVLDGTLPSPLVGPKGNVEYLVAFHRIEENLEIETVEEPLS